MIAQGFSASPIKDIRLNPNATPSFPDPSIFGSYICGFCKLGIQPNAGQNQTSDYTECVQTFLATLPQCPVPMKLVMQAIEELLKIYGNLGCPAPVDASTTSFCTRDSRAPWKVEQKDGKSQETRKSTVSSRNDRGWGSMAAKVRPN